MKAENTVTMLRSDTILNSTHRDKTTSSLSVVGRPSSALSHSFLSLPRAVTCAASQRSRGLRRERREPTGEQSRRAQPTDERFQGPLIRRASFSSLTGPPPAATCPSFFRCSFVSAASLKLTSRCQLGRPSARR